MKKFVLFFYLLAPFFGMGQAITYGSLGSGLDGQPRCLYYDTIDKKLYAGGHFKYAGNKLAWGAAVWDGVQWDSLAGGLTQFPHNSGGDSYSPYFIYKMARYQNLIYCAGVFDYVNGKLTGQLTVWNGSTWVYPIAELPNGQIMDLLVYNNTLYACGKFTKFGNTTCNYVAKFDGSSWQPVGDFTKFYKTFGPPAQVNALAVFKNEIYIGGAFDDSTGTARNIAKFDGSKWVNVGMGIRQSGVNSVFDLAEFKNELYIGGRFSKTPETPGNCIVKWNGSEYKTVGYDILSPGCFISQLKASKKHLVAVGNFRNIGDTATYNLFYLDSNVACYLNDLKYMYLEEVGFSNIEFINDSLLVGGVFDHIGSIVTNNVAVITKYGANSDCFNVGIKETIPESDEIKVYPNPAKDNLTIEFDNTVIGETKANLINILGQVVYTLEIVRQKNEIDLSWFPSGIYFLKLQINSDQKVIKITKE